MTRPVPAPAAEFSPAIAAARAGRVADAVERIERAARGAPSDGARRTAAAHALAHVARLAEAAGDEGQAERALEAALRLRPRWPDLHFRRARLLRALQRPADARAALDRALRLNPGYVAARLERALLDAADGFVGEALESLRALGRETAPGKTAEFERGIESLESADWETAGALFTTALGLDPPVEETGLERARERLEAGDPDGAEALLRSALPRGEAWPDLHYLLGSADLHRGRYDDALASLGRALELNPDFHAARIQLARALEAVGAQGQAGEQVLLVLQSDPAHPQALELHERWARRGRRAVPAR